MTKPIGWASPVTAMLQRLGPGLPGIWALLWATEIGALQLVCLPDIPSDRQLTEAAWDLAEAREDLEWAAPELLTTGVAVTLESPGNSDVPGCRQQLAALLRAGLDLTTAMQSEPGRYDVDVILALARATSLMATAHQRLIGRLP